MSKEKRTFGLSSSSFCFEAIFAQISAKLPKITEKLMTLSISNEYLKLNAKVPDLANHLKNHFKIEQTLKAKKSCCTFKILVLRISKIVNLCLICQAEGKALKYFHRNLTGF